MDKNLIPAKIYKKIISLMPIFCVDIILMFKGKYILLKRNHEPMKGHWWIPGGRVFKGEKVNNAVKRKIKEETGLKYDKLKFVGVYEDSYKKSEFGVPASSISLVYYAQVLYFKPKLDKTSSDIKLSDDLPYKFVKCLKFL